MTDPAPMLQEMVEEFRRYARQELVSRVEPLERGPHPERFCDTLREILALGWSEVPELMDGDLDAADALLGELFFGLGEETLSGAIGAGLICALLPDRLSPGGSAGGSAEAIATYPLFIEPESLSGQLGSRSATLPLVPLAGFADEIVCWLPAESRLLRLRLRDSKAGAVGPIPTLGLRGCPMYDIRLAAAGPGEERDSRPADRTRSARALDSARLWTLGLAAGIFSGGLAQAVSYARVRHQGGDRIIAHSGLRSILAQLDATLLRSRAILHELRAGPTGASAESRNLRPVVADAMESLAEQSQHIIQIFGGYGYMEDTTVERGYRDLAQLAVAFGRPGFDRSSWQDTLFSSESEPAAGGEAR